MVLVTVLVTSRLAERAAFADEPADSTASHVAPPAVAAGQAALERAQAAWEKGDYDVAEPLYAEAVETGGLAPTDVLDAYVHLGSARVVLGKKIGALAAFRSAALLDPHFTVPPEAGKKAMVVAAQARRLLAKVGSVALHTTVLAEVPANASTVVDVTLDRAHAALAGSRIGIYAHDDGGALVHVASVKARTTARFELPGELMLPSTTLRVRVDWLDARANRLASTEDPIHVQALPTRATGETVPKRRPAFALETAPVPPPAERHEGGKGGFWHSPWPYVLGGAALAAAGTALYFATRSGDAVDVTGVRVLTR